MNRRTFILCVSLGLLFVIAAPTTPWGQSRNHSAESDTSSDVAEEAFRASPKLLRAAYAPSVSHSPDSTRHPIGLDEWTIWLARAIFSETKDPREQELVAWVIRNRVETEYRDRTSYREVVLDPYQFSAFNPEAPKRSYFMQLTPTTQSPGWHQALWIAYYVRHADPVYRPFSIKTRHFYSQRSMDDRRMPYWVDHSRFVSPGWNYALKKHRFRFYKEIS